MCVGIMIVHNNEWWEWEHVIYIINETLSLKQLMNCANNSHAFRIICNVICNVMYMSRICDCHPTVHLFGI